MKYKFLTDNGELVQGGSPTEVLTNLKNGSRFEADLDLETYLDALVLRLKEFYGTLITSREHDDILDDMILIGFLKPVK